MSSRVDELIDENGYDKEEVLGDDGLLSQLTKRVIERALNAELTEHLGYERGDPQGNNSGNSRNGTTAKTVHTEHGTVELEVPRDRQGSFEPKLVESGQTRLEGLSERVLGLYAGGMTVRDIRDQLAELYDVHVSHDTISRITDEVADELKVWRARPLDRVYPVIYLDAIRCKVRDEGAVRNKAAHLAVGIDTDGDKHVLGIWIEQNEGATFADRGCATSWAAAA